MGQQGNGSPSPLSPMASSPMGPPSTPYFPTNATLKSDSGLIFWGSAVVPLFELIQV